MRVLKTILLSIFGLLLVAILALGFVISRTDDCPTPPVASTAKETATVITYQCYGGTEVLQQTVIEKPVPGPEEVLVKVHYAGVNPLDWHRMRGSPYIMRLSSGLGAPESHRIGADFAGTVEAVGETVSAFKRGDRVFGGKTGAFGSHIVINEGSAIAHVPDNVTLEQAGVIGIAGVTALQALVEHGQLEAGDTVLVNGASGGVGTFAVQIAKALGAQVTGVSSARNHETVLGLGASTMIDYKTTDYTDLPARYDLIIDMVGNHSPLANSGVLKPDGKLILVGGAKGDWIGPLQGPIASIFSGPFMDQEAIVLFAEMRKETLAELANLMKRGELTSIVGHRYPLTDIAEAMALSESSRAQGKISIAIAP
ncbi:NAD(P)-dependent alcohol dehydrogenase [Halioglobus maricola]|uniref:NAD(P)-dependent alcohol dehydrogenase n=1 Tax=Halioglobus maricola TaxID=2601894 RepID=A0A5P9NLP2_9GAMM|nr:NAD(P)-dependent alcohol dehydrogenase [Halioglobus maricola]QFU76783.1 NAD(P)-dependent alcohol dehydrogenase [Halioglobus maricola]